MSVHHLARLPYRAWLLTIFVVLFVISAINPPYPDDFLWEHVLTAAALALLITLEFRKRPLSDASCTLIFMYMALHVLGAHYTYSEVPYDRWSGALFNISISDLIGAGSYDASSQPRNHYDRLVHAAFGVLLLKPGAELVERWLAPSALMVSRPVASRPTTSRPFLAPRTALHIIIIAAAFLCVLGTLYELLEWLYAAVVGAEAAEHYNGQQGDPFDPQKDLAFNIAGSALSGLILAVRAKRGEIYG